MDGTIVDSSARKTLRPLDGKAIAGYKGMWKLERSGTEGTTLLFKASSLYIQYRSMVTEIRVSKAQVSFRLNLCEAVSTP
ncbi:hypothetical protein MauCBS54593_007447 [Microsporum audouinii]